MTEKKVTVFGLSTDSVETQLKFHQEHQLSFDLISDEKGKIAQALGIPVKLGGRFMARRAYLFRDGKLFWKDEEGATKTQGEEVLAVIKKSS